jgi:hypothetical protein
VGASAGGIPWTSPPWCGIVRHGGGPARTGLFTRCHSVKTYSAPSDVLENRCLKTSSPLGA